MRLDLPAKLHQGSNGKPVAHVATVERPAPRWSSYVRQLRNTGIQIEMEMEPHEGIFASRHARYKLACDVQIKALAGEVQIKALAGEVQQ